MVAVLLGLVAPAFAGWLAVRACWPRAGSAGWRGVYAGSLGLGLALGAGSWTYFVWAVGVGPGRGEFVVAELVFFVVLAVGLVAVGRRSDAPAPATVPSLGRWWRWGVGVAFGLVLLAALATLGLALARRPHGEIDAWQIWTLHARLLARGGDHWREPFAQMEAWSHPDYPLLLPATVARGWVYAGAESTLLPRLVAFLFAAATVGLLMGGLAVLRTPGQGCLAGLVLLATPQYLRLAATQYADVPLGFYFLAGVLPFEARDQMRPGTGRLPLLAGLAAGMAAWTKNEGQLFVVATLLARLVVARAGRRGARPAARELVAFGVGLLPFAAVLAYFKLWLAATNDLVAGQGGGATWSRLLSGERWWLVLSQMAAALALVGGGAVVVLAGYGTLLRRAPASAGRGLHTFAVLALMLAGYALVYVTTPLVLAAHVALSVDRLCLQLWPCALLLFFLNVAAPEERLAATHCPSSPCGVRPSNTG